MISGEGAGWYSPLLEDGALTGKGGAEQEMKTSVTLSFFINIPVLNSHLQFFFDCGLAPLKNV